MLDDLTELPEGWAWTAIEDLCDINPKHDKSVSDELEISFIPMPAIDEITGTIREHGVKKFGEVKKGYTHFANRDVIFAKITPCMENGKAAIGENLINGIACGSTEFYVLRSTGGVLPEYIYNFIRQPGYREIAQQSMSGAVGHQRVPKEFLLETEIPLPPLNEQKRIVAKIEELRSHTQAARNAIAHIPKLLEQFRQSVLAAAFRGDLTAEWRSENPDVEPAEILLQRIRKERRDQLSKTSKPSKYQEPTLPDLETLVDLPSNWRWTTLDELMISLRNGLSKPPLEKSPGIPILRISAVRAREVNIEDIRFYQMEPGENIDSYLLEPGDLLFTRYNGSRMFVGVCGLVRKFKDKLVYPDKLIRVKLVNSNLCLPQFLEFACNVGYSRHHIEDRIKTSAGQHGVSGSDVKSTPIPLPPTLEQVEIIGIIEKQLNVIDRIEQQYQFTKTELDRLDRSILAKAFKGKLVPQDPTDEAAIVLLERHCRRGSPRRSGHPRSCPACRP